ncbi:transposase [Streptomyces sp. NBC_01280]|nr:transposase [Streptomyces sp. NBC_01280]
MTACTLTATGTRSCPRSRAACTPRPNPPWPRATATTRPRVPACAPDRVGHREKWRLALDDLDALARWGLVPPVMVADADYGQNADFPPGWPTRTSAMWWPSVRMWPSSSSVHGRAADLPNGRSAGPSPWR